MEGNDPHRRRTAFACSSQDFIGAAVNKTVENRWEWVKVSDSAEQTRFRSHQDTFALQCKYPPAASKHFWKVSTDITGWMLIIQRKGDLAMFLKPQRHLIISVIVCDSCNTQMIQGGVPLTHRTSCLNRKMAEMLGCLHGEAGVPQGRALVVLRGSFASSEMWTGRSSCAVGSTLSGRLKGWSLFPSRRRARPTGLLVLSPFLNFLLSLCPAAATVLLPFRLLFWLDIQRVW